MLLRIDPREKRKDIKQAENITLIKGIREEYKLMTENILVHKFASPQRDTARFR